MQDALWSGPVETAAMVEKANELNQRFTQLEKTLSQWRDGDRTSLAANDIRELHTVVRPGVGVNLPFVGVQVGGASVVVTEEGIPQLHRLRLHPNSPGSKRSLERKLDAVKLAVSYLLEDLNVSESVCAPDVGTSSGGNWPVSTSTASSHNAAESTNAASTIAGETRLKTRT